MQTCNRVSIDTDYENTEDSLTRYQTEEHINKAAGQINGGRDNSSHAFGQGAQSNVSTHMCGTGMQQRFNGGAFYSPNHSYQQRNYFLQQYNIARACNNAEGMNFWLQHIQAFDTKYGGFAQWNK